MDNGNQSPGKTQSQGEEVGTVRIHGKASGIEAQGKGFLRQSETGQVREKSCAHVQEGEAGSAEKEVKDRDKEGGRQKGSSKESCCQESGREEDRREESDGQACAETSGQRKNTGGG